MKKAIYILSGATFSLIFVGIIYAACPPSWVVYERIITTYPNPSYEKKTWTITWQDGNTSRKSNEATGEYYPGGVFSSAVECMPVLEEPRSFPTSIRNRPYQEWAETAYDRRYNGGCENVPNGLRTVLETHPCSFYSEEGGGDCTTPGWGGSCPPGTSYDFGSGMCCSDSGGGMCGLFAQSDSVQSANLLPDPGGSCCGYAAEAGCTMNGGVFDPVSCTCYSPIVIDTLGKGFNLTNAENGVLFDLTNDGAPERLTWTAANSDDAFLALDRNNNGTIDNGGELFGDSALQSAPADGESKNGFRALALYDRPDRGGNADNLIDSADAVFSKLKLWRDINHNGISEPSELQNLTDSDAKVIELDYKEERRKDENGNWFRFRAKVKDSREAKIGRWAWDVFLQISK